MDNIYKNLIKNISKNKVINSNINDSNFIMLKNKTIDKCPYCKNKEFIKYGNYNKAQRYKCKNKECSKTFNESNECPFRYSHKFSKLWEAYYKLMLNGNTIRECAAKLNITIVTSFFWRHKILHDLRNKINKEELNSYVELTKLIVKENFKGSRNIQVDKRDKIIIVNGIDKNINLFSIIIERNYCTYKRVKECIFQKINSKAYTVAFNDRVLCAVSRHHNDNNKIKIEENLEPIDKIYSIKAKKWIKRFHGVATKYIDNYLSWRGFNYKNNISIVKHRFKKENNDYKIKNLSLEINTYISWKNIKSKAIPV